MGSAVECIDGEHDACSEVWCDCGCHHVTIEAHDRGEHERGTNARCQECLRAPAVES
jgi:hypothetical protein